MRRIEAYMLLLTTITAVFTASLALMGESRIDLYISIAILSHFVSAALTGVEAEVEKKIYTGLTIVLITVFAIIVALRVIEILYPGLIKEVFIIGG